jgi:hypothetical protein
MYNGQKETIPPFSADCPIPRQPFWTLYGYMAVFGAKSLVARGVLWGTLRQGVRGIEAATKIVMDNNINKASVSLLALAALVVAAVAAKVRATVESQAPVGYEDEAGFHFGNPAGE